MTKLFKNIVLSISCLSTPFNNGIKALNENYTVKTSTELVSNNITPMAIQDNYIMKQSISFTLQAGDMSTDNPNVFISRGLEVCSYLSIWENDNKLAEYKSNVLLGTNNNVGLNLYNVGYHITTYVFYTFKPNENYGLYWQGDNLVMKWNHQTFDALYIERDGNYISNHGAPKEVTYYNISSQFMTICALGNLNLPPNIDKEAFKNKIGDNVIKNNTINTKQSFYAEILGAEYQQGYNVGYSDGQKNPTMLSWLRGSFEVVGDALNINVLGNITLAQVLSGFLILTLLSWILRWFK